MRPIAITGMNFKPVVVEQGFHLAREDLALSERDAEGGASRLRGELEAREEHLTERVVLEALGIGDALAGFGMRELGRVEGFGWVAAEVVGLGNGEVGRVGDRSSTTYMISGRTT